MKERMEPQPVLHGDILTWKRCAWTSSEPHCAIGDGFDTPGQCYPDGECHLEQPFVPVQYSEGVWWWILPILHGGPQ